MDKLLPKSSGQVQRSAVGLPGLNVDMDNLLYNLTSAFNPLHRDCLLNYHVAAVNAQQVCMSVVMPREMLQSFSQLLESMGGFFRVVNGKARAASAIVKAHDLDKIAEREQLASDRKAGVCAIFDKLISQGHSSSDAIRLTNNALRAENNPWASRYMVESVLRSEGRLRKSKGGKERK
ncbi:MAG: hypothetical protein M0023_08465 [Desulfobacteraceae bacterium]|nr:hypothetical protein [Desulfobacteraceae bacterium]